MLIRLELAEARPTCRSLKRLSKCTRTVSGTPAAGWDPDTAAGGLLDQRRRDRVVIDGRPRVTEREPPFW